MPSTTVACPKCRSRVTIRATLAPGKKVRCPECQTPFAVPDPDEEDEAPSGKRGSPSKSTTGKAGKPLRDARQDEDEDEEDRPAKRKANRDRDEDEEDRPRPKKGKKSKKSQGNPALVWGLIGGVLLLLIGGGVALLLLLPKGKDAPTAGKGPGDSKTTGGQLADWTPDPAALAQLGPLTRIDNYQIRPPKGYSFEKGGGVRNGRSYSWTGSAGAGGRVPMMEMEVGSGEPGMSLDATFDLYAGQIGYKGTPAKERGRLMGLSFIRARWTSTAPDGKKWGGFMYTALEGDKLITITYHDLEANYQANGKTLEAAVLTLQKR